MHTHSLVTPVVIVGLALGRCLGSDTVALLDLLKHDPADKAVIRLAEEGVFEWSLPDGLEQTLQFDLEKLGIDPNDYDEFRFEIKPEGSQVALHTVLQGFPAIQQPGADRGYPPDARCDAGYSAKDKRGRRAAE